MRRRGALSLNSFFVSIHQGRHQRRACTVTPPSVKRRKIGQSTALRKLVRSLTQICFGEQKRGNIGVFLDHSI